MTSDATSITLTGSSNIPILTTGKIIASTGTCESGLAWTGIIATNTAGQEMCYTNNTRDIIFRGNAVVDGIRVPNSLQCVNDATIAGGLTVDGPSYF